MPFPSPRGLPNPGIKPRSPALQADSLPAEPHGSPRTLESVAYLFSSGSSDPGIEPGSPALQADSLPAEPLEKPKNTGVGSLSLLQQIFPTQESNWSLLHCRQILYQLSHQGSLKILEWVVYPFSSRSSQPRNRTWVSCITGRFFTI